MKRYRRFLKSSLSKTLAPVFILCLVIPRISAADSAFTLPSFSSYLVPDGSSCVADITCISGLAQSMMDSYFSGAKVSLGKDFRKIFGKFGEAFGKNYGSSVLDVAHLTYPVGLDNLGDFPGFNAGLGLGVNFANKNAIAETISSEYNLPIGDLPLLPALGIGINAGLALSENWDARVSFLYPFEIAVPEDLLGDSGFGLSLSFYSFKGSMVRKLFDKGMFNFGLSLGLNTAIVGGQMNMSTGDTSQSAIAITESNGATNFNGTLTPTYSMGVEADWFYYSGGFDLKLWFNLIRAMKSLIVIAPYVGWGLSMQGGLFTTSFIVDVTTVTAGNMTNGTGTAAINTTTENQIVEDFIISPYWFLQRFTIGMEIRLFTLTINVETQIDTVNKLAGVAVGVSFNF